MKNVFPGGSIFIGSALGLVVGLSSGAFAKGVLKIRPAGRVRCLAGSVEIASEDPALDRRRAKTLGVYDGGRLLARAVSVNAERIEFLERQCAEATASAGAVVGPNGRGRVSVDTTTAEVLPLGGFRPTLRPRAEVSVRLMSQHKIPVAKKHPGTL